MYQERDEEFNPLELAPAYIFVFLSWMMSLLVFLTGVAGKAMIFSLLFLVLWTGIIVVVISDSVFSGYILAGWIIAFLGLAIVISFCVVIYYFYR